jgi:hypothetical protein
MDNKPKELTAKEIMEIAAVPDVQQMWGARNAEEMASILRDDVFAVKFDFHSGAPGYVGDYFIIQGDQLGVQALELIRNEAGKIEIINNRHE